MKPVLLVTLSISLLSVANLCKAQNAVTDTHPGSIIYAIDYSSGQENMANDDQAILFKDALIELVTHTAIAKAHTMGAPGHKTFTVTQMNPQTNGNAYQLILETKFMGQTTTLYTFLYNADENTLAIYDNQSQNYQPVLIEGYNLNNLNNCLAYGKFNAPQQQPTDQGAPETVAIPSDNPVDVNVQAKVTPPEMPEYQQPECPVDGYLWQPGYWAYSVDSNGYYWVPGAWVAPPNVDLLWTPPYWGYNGGFYIFHTGYWGNSVGFYGGINYGYGYGGYGYGGGEWYGGHYRYNTAVVRVNTTVIHNTYINNRVVNNTTINNRASFNGQGGVVAKPDARQVAAMRETHIMPTPEQNRNQQIARADKSQFAAINGGRPATLAAAKVPTKAPMNSTAPSGARSGMNGTPNNNGRAGAVGNTNNNKPATNGTFNNNRPATNGTTNNRSGMNSATNVPQSGNLNNAQRFENTGAAGMHPSVPGSTGNHPPVPGAQGQGNTRQGMPGQPNNRNGGQNSTGSRGSVQPRQNNKAPAENKQGKDESKKKQ